MNTCVHVCERKKSRYSNEGGEKLNYGSILKVDPPQFSDGKIGVKDYSKVFSLSNLNFTVQ